jgi:hypothetical protein
LVSIAVAAFLGTNTLVAKVAWTGTYCEGGIYPTGICWPDGAWDSTTVSSAQMSQTGVDDPHNFLIGTAKRDRYVLLRNGKIVRRYGNTTSRKNCGSQCKFIISTMLMFARKEGLIDGLTTEAAYDKKLKDYSSFAGLNTGDGAFDSNITFKHVANQMSGYALAGEGPTKWAYNDLGMNLFWKALHRHVFTTEFNNGTGLAGATDARLANPLQFQNSGTATGKLFTSRKKNYGDQKNNTESDDTFCTGTGWRTDGVDDIATADSPNPPACRGLYGYFSVEDLARVLYFWLRKGKWKIAPYVLFPDPRGDNHWCPTR